MSLSSEEYGSDSKRLIAEMAELIGGLAHELRNPLSTMMVNLQLLAEDLKDDRPHPDDTRRRALHRVEVLQREAARLQHLFDAFLNVANPCGPVRTDADVAAVITRLVEFYQPVADDNAVQIELSLPERPLTASVDANLLRQALLNLVINAQQAMPDGGVLRVAAEEHDGRIRVSVSDTGVGIAEEDRPRILRPFYSTKAGGHGLGLAFVRRVIREHGGSLSFTSAPGSGTTFTLDLPVRPGEDLGRAGETG